MSEETAESTTQEAFESADTGDQNRPQFIPFSSIVASTKVQSRASIDKHVLADYTAIAKTAHEKGADTPFPPGVVFKTPEGVYLLASGFTRTKSEKAAGYSGRLYYVKEGTERDAYNFALSDNLKHGARYSDADKAFNLTRVLSFPENRELSNVAIADLIGATEGYVRKHRPAAETPTTKTVTRSGKKHTMNTAGVGRKGGKKTKPEADPSKDGTAADEALNGAVDGASSAPAGKKGAAKKDEGMDADTERALTKICNVIGTSHGFDGKAIKESILNNTLKLSSQDIRAWADTTDSRIILITPLVVDRAYKPAAAFGVLDNEVNSNTKTARLVNLSIAGQAGFTKGESFGEIGMKLADQPEFRVLAYDTRLVKVTVEILAPAAKTKAKKVKPEAAPESAKEPAPEGEAVPA